VSSSLSSQCSISKDDRLSRILCGGGQVIGVGMRRKAAEFHALKAHALERADDLGAMVILESPAQAQGFWVLEISFVDFEIHLGLHRARLRLVVAVVDSSIRFSGLPTSAVDNVANRSMADPEFSGVMSDESS